MKSITHQGEGIEKGNLQVSHSSCYVIKNAFFKEKGKVFKWTTARQRN